jgi:hypothetical protein
MAFWDKKRTSVLQESGEHLCPQLMDLTYSYSDRILNLVVQEGLVQDDNSSETLRSFLEIVSFAYCWVELEIETRFSRQKKKDLGPIFSSIRYSWGSFFADYPDGPRLEGESAETVDKTIVCRCREYHGSYLSNLRANGVLYALRHSCAGLVTNVCNPYEAEARVKDEAKKRVHNLKARVVRRIGELVYALRRDIGTLLVKHTF